MKFGKADRNYDCIEEKDGESDLEEGYFGHENVSLRFTERQIEEKEQIYQQKISEIIQRNRIPEDELDQLIASLQRILNYQPDDDESDEITTTTNTSIYLEDHLFAIQRWIEKAEQNPVIKGNLPPFTLTGDYNDAVFPILSEGKAPWWKATAHLEKFDHSEPKDDSLGILDGWCNYDETEQYFQQSIDREIQFREAKEKERSDEEKADPRHYPHFSTDMTKGVPAWDVTQNSAVRQRYEEIEYAETNPRKKKRLNRYSDAYFDRLVETFKGIMEGTISKDEKKRLALGNAKKTSEEMRKQNELDNPNRKWKRRTPREFLAAKRKSMIEWQKFCEISSK